jgi:hypothetical protein
MVQIIPIGKNVQFNKQVITHFLLFFKQYILPAYKGQDE